jgi:molybdopterin adenylyltransferase
MNIRIAILTISDRSAAGLREDTSGPALQELARQQGWQVVQSEVVADDLPAIRNILESWADAGAADLIVTTGGTGFGHRDVTPEATLAAVERQAPGLAEAMRAESLRITPHAMLSRAVAGIRKRALIVNLPGSPKGAVESLSVILPALPHAVELLRGDPGSETGHQTPDKR